MKTFRGLRGKQLQAFEQVATGSTGFSFARKTMAALEAKGLIVGHEFPIYGSGNSPIDRIPIMARQFLVPPAIHAEWCQWCADNTGDDDGRG